MALKEVRGNAPEYYGTSTQLDALDTTNLPSGTIFLVFDADTKKKTATKIYVEGIGWCTFS